MQASISSVVKSSDSRLDLGKLEIDDHGAIQLPGSFFDLRDRCKHGRMPPLAPDMVARKLKEEKKFTNDSDVSKVAGLYKRFFDAVSTSTEALEFWTQHSRESRFCIGFCCCQTDGSFFWTAHACCAPDISDD